MMVLMMTMIPGINDGVDDDNEDNMNDNLAKINMICNNTNLFQEGILQHTI